VIFTAANAPPAIAAKAATQTIPIVFEIGADPVEIGLVASLARPGGNITGVTTLAGELSKKRLAVLHELVPAATTIAFLVNPNNPAFSPEGLLREQTEASALGIRLLVLNASSPSDIEHIFTTFAEQRVGALLVGPEAFFSTQRAQLVALATRYAIPASYARREAVEIGGLISYSADYLGAFRDTGRYVGRILNGEKSGDLPVQQSTRFELAINLKTAKALGLTVPPYLLAIADRVIE
jgi:putative tryptophan/tyrosine transport system substrate-binding protein